MPSDIVSNGAVSRFLVKQIGRADPFQSRAWFEEEVMDPSPISEGLTHNASRLLNAGGLQSGAGGLSGLGFGPWYRSAARFERQGNNQGDYPHLKHKTIEYMWPTRITTLATNTTLATATRLDTASMTVYVPETAERVFKSVRLVVKWHDDNATDIGDVGWRLGIKLGSATTQDLDRTFTAVKTNDHKRDVVDYDVTDYFNLNFGTGASQTCVASIAVATDSASTINGITFRLVVTYGFDSLASTTRIKTIRIPIQSQISTLTTSQQEVGTDGTSPAPANQIPALDTFLPEASKTYRQVWLELTGNDGGVTNAAITPFFQIDAATETACAPITQTLVTQMPWEHLADMTGVFTTSAAHSLSMRADVTARMTFAGATLYVTYEYNSSTTTTAMFEVMVPLTMPTDDGFGQNLGASTKSVAGDLADVNVYTAAFNIQEPGTPTIAQSGVYFDLRSMSTPVPTLVKTPTQVGRSYTTISSGGDAMVVHRVDNTGWTVARGDNRLTFVVSGSSSNYRVAFASAYALINYTASVPSDVDIGNHPVNYMTTTYEGATSVSPQQAANTPAQHPPILGSPYKLTAVIQESYIRTVNTLGQTYIGINTGEFDSGGNIFSQTAGPTLAENSSWRNVFAYTSTFNADHLHTGKCDIQARRIYGRTLESALSANAVGLFSSSFWITYHQITYTVAGTVTIHGVAAADGKTVSIFALDSAGKAELITTTTIAGGAGAFTTKVLDNTRTYWSSYVDGTIVGRSQLATPA